MGPYFDLQVNGYAGVDFNCDDLPADRLHHACELLARDGVEKILATIITADVETMCRRLATLVTLRSRDPLAASMIAGLHIEGPFLNPKRGFIGAHASTAVQPASVEAIDRLFEAGDGLVRLLTLAPECDPGFAGTRHLSRQGVCVSAGHTDASLDTLKGAADAGLSMFTHLGNGCPMSGMDRHDNIVQRALFLRDRLWLCFIADGTHVPYMALANYVALAGVDRCCVVSDAMAAAGFGPGRYRLGTWDVEVGDDGAAWAPDRTHLVGSACPLHRAETQLRQMLGLDANTCRKLFYDNPLRAITPA